MQVFTQEKLNNKDFLNSVIEKVDQIEFHNNVNDAYKVHNSLQKALADNEGQISEDFFETYHRLAIRLEFLLFNTLPYSRLKELFSKHLSIGIKMNYLDLLEVLKAKVSFLAVDDRDDFKEQLKKVLLENQEILTKSKLKTENREIRPTVSAWLHDYIHFVGTGAKSSLEQSTYFIKSKNISTLDESEKLELKELISIYEYLQRSSSTMEGNEDELFFYDEDRKIYSLKNGTFFEIKTSSQKQRTKTAESGPIQIQKSRELASQYPENSLERKAIEEEIKRSLREAERTRR